MKRLVLGTRGSKLAVTQSQWVADRLCDAHADLKVELEIIRTSGDIDQTQSLPDIGGKGLFTAELDHGLLEGRIDIAVHSMKDLPTEETAGLGILAVPLREPPNDVLLSDSGVTFSELPPGARVGTGSLRRLAQLKHARPELEYRDIRGNVDTRMNKLRRGDYEAIILAAAGLMRLGLSEHITEMFDTERMLPAVGQGALAVTGRRDDQETHTLVGSISHEPTFQAVIAERAMLEALGGGCHVPIAAHATISGQELHVLGLVAAPDGSNILRDNCTGHPDHAEELGRKLGERLLSAGAAKLLQDFK